MSLKGRRMKSAMSASIRGTKHKLTKTELRLFSCKFCGETALGSSQLLGAKCTTWKLWTQEIILLYSSGPKGSPYRTPVDPRDHLTVLQWTQGITLPYSSGPKGSPYCTPVDPRDHHTVLQRTQEITLLYCSYFENNLMYIW